MPGSCLVALLCTLSTASMCHLTDNGDKRIEKIRREGIRARAEVANISDRIRDD